MAAVVTAINGRVRDFASPRAKKDEKDKMKLIQTIEVAGTNSRAEDFAFRRMTAFFPHWWRSI